MFCTSILHSQLGELLGFQSLTPHYKLLRVAECLKFSMIGAQILAPKVVTNSLPILFFLISLRSKPWLKSLNLQSKSIDWFLYDGNFAV